ncbi:ergothioneine biosynthesis protein EgtB (plasmid) [Persicobacter psychrovividus]|uniref:Ergothioneine biosynthesis protein EgtB n=2 Tax=Persicobacter psychrovividus TaxID=387638 RepID=A0ABN6LF89_9BACT|nr:ergothioneine biosynthesis protein EgtB [Persicobacter psychrovividus]
MICSPLAIEDYIPQPSVDVSPPKWHLGHTTWFFEEMVLAVHSKEFSRYNPKYAYVFNSYYETIGDRVERPQRGWMSRPTVSDVLAYRRYVDERMEWLIEGISFFPKEVKDLVILGLQHEQQHQELLYTDIKYTLNLNPMVPVYEEDAELVNDYNSDQGFLEIREGLYDIGFEGEGFCFDNEKGRHKVFLPAFSIAKGLVTNQEYLEFIEDGGYEKHDLWHAQGWDWLKSNQLEHPMYWRKEEGHWKQFTLGGLMDLDPHAQLAHINYYEAYAFAQWKGMRLPTEFEWEVASGQLSWGSRWEWTQSAYLPYPKYQKAEGAVGEYNGKFMVSQMVLRGASVATSPDHSRPTYRNFFHPELSWQFTGIRLVQN